MFNEGTTIKGAKERNSDLEAQNYISDRVDIEGLSKKMQSEMFSTPGNEGMLNTIARLVYELKENIPEYESVIGDDTKGRIPTLILWGLIRKARAESGKKPIQAFFVAAGRYNIKSVKDETYKLIKTFFKKQKLGKKTLICTEYISSGDSIGRLSQILNDLNISHDISSVNISSYCSLETKKGKGVFGNVIFGREGVPSYLDPLSNSIGSGVERSKVTASAHAFKTFDDYFHQSIPGSHEITTNQVAATRKDIKLIVEELYKLF